MRLVASVVSLYAVSIVRTIQIWNCVHMELPCVIIISADFLLLWINAGTLLKKIRNSMSEAIGVHFCFT